ncbi:hypothetical protein ACFSTH_12145 [Paenibacillus yanchengensis]|uniref:DUF4064 domain-containing protein n=1 Tax=Paenibacillus yanchengensis TaxID=2035833 RepID=A0ABW4YN65_9BACL
MDNQQQDQDVQNQRPYHEQTGYTTFAPYSEMNAQLTHSKLGIASFVIAIVAVITMAITFAMGYTTVMQLATNPETLEQLMSLANDPTALENNVALQEVLGTSLILIVVATILLFAGLIMAFVGLILGIIGLTAKYKKKVFAIIGVVLNSIVLVGAFALFVISFFTV